MNIAPVRPRTTPSQVKLRATEAGHRNGDGRGHERPERGVKRHHGTLDQARSRHLPIELPEKQRLPLGRHLVSLWITRQLFELCSQKSDAIDHPAQPCAGGKDQCAAGGDQHGRRDHRGEHGECIRRRLEPRQPIHSLSVFPHRSARFRASERPSFHAHVLPSSVLRLGSCA